MFNCDKCGSCCRNLDKSKLYEDLDRGDGTCKFLKDNLCTIYENRPLKCRVDDCYDNFFCEQISREEYYRINKKACRILRRTEE